MPCSEKFQFTGGDGWAGWLTVSARRSDSAAAPCGCGMPYAPGFGFGLLWLARVGCLSGFAWLWLDLAGSGSNLQCKHIFY